MAGVRNTFFLTSTNIPNWWLVGGFNPIENYAPQIGSFPQVGANKNIQKNNQHHNLEKH